MKRFSRSCLLATLIACALGVTARADDFRSARVSDVRGNLSVRGAEDDDFSYVERNAVIRHEDVLWTDDDGRAEIELDRGSWVRLAEDTKLEVRALPPSAEFRLWNGSVYLDLSDRMEGRTLLKTPVGDVEVDPDSVVRVDLDKSESARVSVFNGRARAFPDSGSSVGLGPGERIYLDAGRPAPDPTRFDRGDQDGFDRYHRERVDYFINRPVPRELREDIVGARELNDYGSWVVVENISYWRPRCEPTWRPYSAGYWSYVPGCGYSWVDYAPWGYTTCHYGRWLYRPTYGWLWAPGYAWAPSYVYWSSYGNYCGWAPLDPWDRPCYYGAGNGFNFAFGTGSFFVDFRSWTFCDRDRFFFGRHHRRFGGHSFFAGNEINLRPDGFRPFRDANRELGIPRHSVRGITVSDRGILARDRVLQLENRVPQARQRLIEDRFKVAASRDRDLLKRGSEVEQFQRNPGTKIDPSRLLRGDEAEKRLRRDREAGDSRQVRDRQPGDRQSGDRVTGTPGAGQPRGRDERPDVKPGDRQTDARDRGGRDSGFRRGQPGNRRGGEDTPGTPSVTEPSNRDRTPDSRRGDRGPDANRPDTVKPGDRTPADRSGDRDSIFRRGEGRRSEDKPGEPARSSDPGRRDPAQPDNQRRENERRDNERRDNEQREAQRRENERREAERRENDRKEAERRDNERRDAERRESERRESERRDAERRDNERRESERRDSDRKPGSRGGAFQDFPSRSTSPSTEPSRSGSDDRFRRGGDTGRPSQPSQPSYRDFRSTPSTPSAPSQDRDRGFRRTAPGDGGVRTAPSTPDSGSYRSPSYSRGSEGTPSRSYGRGSYGDRSPTPSSPSSPGYSGSRTRDYSSPAPSGGYSRGPGSYGSPSPSGSPGRGSSSYSSPSPSGSYGGGSYGRGSGSYSSPSRSGGYSRGSGTYSLPSRGGSYSGSRGYSGSSGSGGSSRGSGSGSSSGGRGGFSSGGFRR